MIRKKETIPYYKLFLLKAFADQEPKSERTKSIGNITSFQRTNQNNQKGSIKR